MVKYYTCFLFYIQNDSYVLLSLGVWLTHAALTKWLQCFISSEDVIAFEFI